MSRKLGVALAAALALALASTAAAMTPRQLYGKLLTNAYRPIPSGYYQASSRSPASGADLKFSGLRTTRRLPAGSDLLIAASLAPAAIAPMLEALQPTVPLPERDFVAFGGRIAA